jgi:hypothetical protein
MEFTTCPSPSTYIPNNITTTVLVAAYYFPLCNVIASPTVVFPTECLGFLIPCILCPLDNALLGWCVPWMARPLDEAALYDASSDLIYIQYTKRAIPMGWFWHYTEIVRVSCRVHRLGVGWSERCLDCPWWPAGRQGQPKIRERLMWLSTACIRMPSMIHIFIGLADKQQGEGEGSEKSGTGHIG